MDRDLVDRELADRELAYREPRRRRLAGLLGLVGLVLILQGLWIPAKAQLAQVLLEVAWVRTAEGETARPWPWADTWPVARLRAPAYGIDHVVLEGASGSVLAFAPGRDASPEPGHTVLGGHRDTHFKFLKDMRVGDALEWVSKEGEVSEFRMTWAVIVDHRDTGVLESDGEALTLVTCRPFDAVVPGGPLRYVVRAEPVQG